MTKFASRFAPVLALSVLLATVSPLPAQAQTATPSADRVFDATTLNLSAFGEIKIAPDQATITLGVQTTAPTAAAATSQNAAQMAGILAALRRAGLPDKAISTSSISLSAQYEYKPNLPRRLTGYQASNEVSITVDDIARLSVVLDSVVSAGSNQISGISFGLKNPGAAEDTARIAAVKALRAKADLYASAAGYHVLRLVNLSEGGGYQPSFVGRSRDAVAITAFSDSANFTPSTPVSPGELTVRVNITGLYELSR